MRTFAFVLACAAFAGSASAVPLLYDPFDYTAGSQLSGQTNPSGGQQWMLVTAATGTNLADPKVSGGSLPAPAGLPAPTGNSVVTDRTQTGSSRITLSGAAPTSGTVYYSALVRVNDISAIGTAATGSFFAGLNNTAGAGLSITSAGGALLIHDDPDPTTAAYNLGIGVTTANNDRIFDTTPLTAGQTVFVVGSYTFNPGADNDVSQLWINPNVSLFAANTPPAPTVISDAAVTAGTSTENAQLASFFLRNNGVEPAQIQIDEVRVGTSPSDVVPEPASAGVLGLAAVAALAARRRRRLP